MDGRVNRESESGGKIGRSISSDMAEYIIMMFCFRRAPEVRSKGASARHEVAKVLRGTRYTRLVDDDSDSDLELSRRNARDTGQNIVP